MTIFGTPNRNPNSKLVRDKGCTSAMYKAFTASCQTLTSSRQLQDGRQQGPMCSSEIISVNMSACMSIQYVASIFVSVGFGGLRQA